ncbi:cystatin-9-like [Ochotona curzoniae]|uniref:cystatin-9-like n=1 Tax=Ochotona curzoniae TaxID=130825 RepID=UPI001B3504EF|nr:cystatin-9-like [Ochotona curzoniae]
MLRGPGKRALPWALLPLLLGLQLPSVHTWCSEEQKEIDNKYAQYPYLSVVRFAEEAFNKEMEDDYFYRRERILQLWREKGNYPVVFSMELLMHRTICKKTEADIEDCPFQKGTEFKHVRQGSSFPALPRLGAHPGGDDGGST